MPFGMSKYSLPVILLFVLTTGADAQDSQSSQGTEAEDLAAALRLVRDQAGADLTGGGPVQRPEVLATLEVNEKNSAVSVIATFEDTKGRQLTLGLKAPFDAETTEQTFVTADRLGGDVTASASLAFRLWNGALPEDPGVCSRLNREALLSHYKKLGTDEEQGVHRATGALDLVPPDTKDAPLEVVVRYAREFRSKARSLPLSLQNAYDLSWEKQRRAVCAGVQPTPGRTRDPGVEGRDELQRTVPGLRLEDCTLGQAAGVKVSQAVVSSLAEALVKDLPAATKDDLAADAIDETLKSSASQLGLDCSKEGTESDPESGVLCTKLREKLVPKVLEEEKKRWEEELERVLTPLVDAALALAADEAERKLVGALDPFIAQKRVCPAGESTAVAKAMAHASRDRGSLQFGFDLEDALARHCNTGPTLPGGTPNLLAEADREELEKLQTQAREREVEILLRELGRDLTAGISNGVSQLRGECRELCESSQPCRNLTCAFSGVPDCCKVQNGGSAALRDLVGRALIATLPVHSDSLRAFYGDFYRKVAADLVTEQEKLSTLPTEGLFLEGKPCRFEDQLSRVLSLEKGPTRRGLFRDLSASLPDVLYLTLSAEAATTDYKWFSTDPPSFNEEGKIPSSSDAKTASSYGAALSVFHRGVFLSAGLSLSNEFKAQDSIEVCLPIPGSTTLRCLTGRTGEPEPFDHKIWEASLKYYLTPELAAHLQLLFDDEGDFLNPHGYLYFLPVKGEDGKNKLRGGLDLFFRRNDPEGNDGPGARLFFGVPFEIPAFGG